MTVEDLIKTIDDEDEVPDYSESSEEEEELQPKARKKRRNKDFHDGFEFVSSLTEYNKDPWDDLYKYVKRKANNKTDEKIKNARESLKKEDNGNEENDDEENVEEKDFESGSAESELSADELVHDTLKEKTKKIGKKKLKRLKKAGLEIKDEESESEDDKEKVKFDEAPPCDESLSFYEMNLSRPILKAIQAMKFVHPTPIQSQAIPVALEGRDICGAAPTGTGKTGAFMIPTLERLVYKPTGAASVTRVLCLVPTRELGVQVYQVTKQLAQFTRIDIALAVGGLDVKAQEAVLRKSPDVVIATPGRLIDHLKNTPGFSLDNVEVLIIDEADRMLDENFKEQMKEIMRCCSRTRQCLLFSATMTEGVEELATVCLNRPIKLGVDTSNALKQEFVRIRNEGDREAILAALVCRTFRENTMVFVQTRKQAHRLHIMLGLLGVKAGELHGDMTQPQRLEALRKFRAEEIDVLVATDLAARGLDITGVATVINFVLPVSLEHYVHRVGRTARAGRAGISVSLAGQGERTLIKSILKKFRGTPKQRLIPQEILKKYRAKVEVLEEKIKGVLEEEWSEKALKKAENEALKAEKSLKGETKEKRDWFQTHKEREEEKERLRLEELPKGKNKKGRASRRKKNKGENPEERAQREIEKVALYQAREAKRKRKGNKLIAVHEAEDKSRNQGQKRGKRSAFDSDLTDTRRKNVKRLRHEATHEKNLIKFGRKDKQPGKRKKK
ncbi:probable ATP-dependent RNA helicase DDX27 [Halyomorpha halys]|uniref:probable ATP-dependent RNA helicase DDX27 n=1 Tax=Halyomorpha halys TaxID=286706 RepID=UPI0006D4EE77|nr:probable ATP-dependent RNA helicase DDX27 [Halyomorpha halys]